MLYANNLLRSPYYWRPFYTPLGLEYETVDVLTGNVITRKEYDNKSRLIKVSEYIYGSVTEYEYDYLDRIISETGATTASYCKTYTYDLAGNRTGFTLEKGGETVNNINYSYDNLNRLSTVSENGAANEFFYMLLYR